jgi:hypothetical protein
MYSRLQLKECGEHWQLKEFRDKEYAYNYTYSGTEQGRYRGERKTPLPTEESVRRREMRRKARVRDLINTNAWEWRAFHTYTDYGELKYDTARHHQELYLKRLERFVQSGRLFSKPIQEFQANENFKLKALGMAETQEGKRKNGGNHTLFWHYHQVHNVKWIPPVWALRKKGKDGKWKYRQKGGRLSLVADKNTIWREKEGEISSLANKGDVAVQISPYALLWGRGFIDIETIGSKEGHKDLGRYMVENYLENKGGGAYEDDKVGSKKLMFQRGKLDKPTIYRDEDEINQILYELQLWNHLESMYKIDSEYMGNIVISEFNLWKIS